MIYHFLLWIVFFSFCPIFSSTDAINALINGTGSSENITSDESARLIEEARRIVDEIKARDFDDNEFMTSIELNEAEGGKILLIFLLLKGSTAPLDLIFEDFLYFLKK